MKVWVKTEKTKRRKKDKREERIWNFTFLIVGAAISAIVTLWVANAQLAIAIDPTIEVTPSDIVKGKGGEFELSIRNPSLSDLTDIAIYKDFFVTETLGAERVQLTTIGPLILAPIEKINLLQKHQAKQFIINIKPILKQMAEFYKNKSEGLQMRIIRLTVKYHRKSDGKEFIKNKAYVIDLSGDVFIDYSNRGIGEPIPSFDDIKKILGVE